MESAGFFILRTPYLPAKALLALGDHMESDSGVPDAATLERDRARVHRFLDELFARPDIAEALYLASPSLSRRLENWRNAPAAPSASRIERALLSYASRMATRATPFGLFAGWSSGELGPDTRLQLAATHAYGRRTSLDSGFLVSLGEALLADPSIAANLHFVPNPTLYEAGDRLRYVLARGREVDLVAITPDKALRRVLEHARLGATAGVLSETVRDTDDGIELDEAAEYVGTLIEQQILIGGLDRFVTGPDPLDALIEKLAGVASADVLEALQRSRSLVRDLDSRPAGTGLGHIHMIAEALRPLPVPVDPARLVRCDLEKPADAALSAEVVTVIGNGVDLLARIGGSTGGDPLRAFKTAFMRRYGDREVSLYEALDADYGVGFPDPAIPGPVSAGSEPLLEGLQFPSIDDPAPDLFGPRDALLAGWLLTAAREGRRELVLGPEEVAELERVTPRTADLPSSLSAMATVLASGPEAVTRGDYRVYLSGAAGPSGANLLGRFCGGDDDLTDRVRAYLRAEEDQQPDAVFAEIVHLPEPRLGNVLTRPVLRRYEIVYLGQSGAAPDNQIPAADLRVSVRAGRVVLRSARLEREIIPRLTAAHNFTGRGNIALYRFLGSLQHQAITPWLSFSFGALRNAQFLPRVSTDRFILSRARWTIGAGELTPVREGSGVARFEAMRALRAAHGLPRWVAVADGDRLIAVDLANVVFVDVVAGLARERGQLSFVELFLGPDELLASGPEGAYTHELIVPMRNTAAAPISGDDAQSRTAAGAPPLVRRLAPGSEWLFVKLYTGAASADRVLRSVVRPIVSDALAAGTVDEWFFVRYSDPDWHLRLRLHGDGAELLGEVLPALTACCDARLQDGLIWRMQVDTYEREVERYGGANGLLLAERVFFADSEAALGVVERLDGDETADARWQFAFVGAHQLLTDLGLDLVERHAVVSAARARFARRFRVDTPLRRQLGKRYRIERAGLERAMHDPAGPLAAFAARSAALRAVRIRLPDTVDAELRHSWAASIVHMQINRILRAATNRQEFVIYDLLTRHYESELARRG
ncbi:lantibiotic dehydratase [Nocardia sp. GCM10030253]|uniref:lantibiotic dehydratase n=1 Tax=Nocardia sp. GCM10030253 TaxID=3273404 RepID=UPI003670B9D8